jgi:3-oxoadipate enol-lactonase
MTTVKNLFAIHNARNLRLFSSNQTFRVLPNSIDVKTVVFKESHSDKKLYYLDKGEENDLPPIVLLGGTGQTVDTFTPHISQITKSRRLIVPELRGQGRTQLDTSLCNMRQQVRDLKHVLDRLDIKKVHLGGFSFGGRVAVAFAAHHPECVEKLSITGVPLTRPPLGKLILSSWAEGLANKNMRECAWSFVLNGYSESFLVRNAEHIPLYVDMIVKSNDPSKIRDLIVHSGSANPDDKYGAAHCAKLVQCPAQVIGCTHDRLAAPEQVQALANEFPEAHYIEMATGHLAPFERPVVWRNHILAFFNNE